MYPYALPGATNPQFAPPPPPANGGTFDPEQVWASLASTFSRRRKLFGMVLGGFIALVLIGTLLTPKTYTTEVKLIAGTRGSGAPIDSNAVQVGSYLPALNAMLSVGGAHSAETYAELFRQEPIAQKVVDDLHLNVRAKDLLGAIKVKPVTNTSILTVDVTWRDRETSAAIANDLAKVYVDRERDLVAAQADGAINALKAQLPIAERRMRQTQAAVSRYGAAHGIADISAQTTAAVQAQANVAAKLSDIQREMQQARAQETSLSSQLASMSPTTGGERNIAPNPILPQLRTQLAQVDVQLRAARQQYTDQHPTVQGLMAQRKELVKQIAAQPATIVADTRTVANPVYQQLSQQLAAARATEASDSAQITVLQSQLHQLDPTISKLPFASADISRLKMDQKSAEDVYAALSQRYNDALVAKTTALSDVTVTQPADPADAVKRPSLLLNLVVALILGLIVATATVAVVDYLDHRVRTQRDIEDELGLPVLATVPLLPPAGGAGAAKIEYATDEAFLQLVTSLKYSSDRPLRTLAVTSPQMGDGKSTVAARIGRTLGEIASYADAQKAPRILIIDCDLRRPSMHGRFGVEPNALGLSDVIVGRIPLSDAIHPTEYPNVDIIVAGTHSPNPIKLLQSARFDAVLREASQRYASVVLDAPALGPVFDAAVLSAKADGTILVVSANKTDVRVTRKALGRLEGVGVQNVVGVVFNRSTTSIEEYGDFFPAVSTNEVPLTALPEAAAS